MTEKRFILIDGVKKGTHSGIWDNLKQNNQRVGDELWVGEVVAMLNEGIAIVEENEQLKTQLQNTSDQRDEFHRGARENANRVGKLEKENEQLKKDVEYWKQVASQYSNELNVFEHCKKYKTECKDIHWSSD